MSLYQRFEFHFKGYDFCDSMWLIDYIHVIKSQIECSLYQWECKIILFSLGQLISNHDQTFIASCMKCRVNDTTQEPQCLYELCSDNSMSKVYCSKV